MRRKLLIITSQPLEPAVTAELEGSNWTLQITDTAADARRELGEHHFLVGLFVLHLDDDERYQADLVQIVTQARDVRWIGGLDRERLASESYLSLVAEHLHDFVSLPLDPQRLAVIVGHAYGLAELDRQFISRQQRPLEGEFGMLGSSAPMRALFETIHQASASEAPVVVYGETGSGKEAAARAIHAASSRAQAPFMAIHCAAVPPSSLHPDARERGSTGAGYFDIEHAFTEENAGGTLFLDDVANLPNGAQTRLISLIDSESRARGNHGSAPWEGAQLRIICASDTDLESRVYDGKFRRDLFYRLQVLSMRVPNLHERGEDVWILARHFLQQFQEGRPVHALGFSKDSLAVLARHDWPGNLRELRNRIHKATLSCDGPYIAPAHLDLEKRGPGRNRSTLQEVREDAERQAVVAAVKRNLMNLSKAAHELGVSRMTLYRMLEKHGIEIERSDPRA